MTTLAAIERVTGSDRCVLISTGWLDMAFLGSGPINFIHKISIRPDVKSLDFLSKVQDYVFR